MGIDNFRYYEFGEYKLDSRRRSLEKNGREITITTKNYELLLALVVNDGRVLSHDELLEIVWPDTFVEQSNLKKGISAIRQILGETPESSLFIKTIPRKGYSFIAPVRAFNDEETLSDIHITQTEIIVEEEIVEFDDEPSVIKQVTPQIPGPPRGKRSKLPVYFALGVLLLLIGGSVFRYFYGNRKADYFSALNFENLKPQKLSTSGQIGELTLSPDGKFFVYTLAEGQKKQSLWVRRVGNMNSLALIEATNQDFRFLDVSPDNDFIYYSASTEGGIFALYQIPILGGNPRKILENISSNVSFSPDGKKIGFVRDATGKGRALLIHELESGAEREVFNVTGDNHGIIGPRWSPDGSRFAFMVSEKTPSGRNWALKEVSAEGGTPREITKPQKGKIYAFDWLGDGSGLVMTADLENIRQSQIFKVEYPAGRITRLTNDLLNYHGISVSKDGKAILAVQQEQKADLWGADFSQVNESRQLTQNLNLPNRFIYLPDGRFLGEANENGVQSLFTITAEGKNNQPFLQPADIDRFPSVTPDGKSVLFVSRRSGADQIWEASLNGTNPRKLTDEQTFISNPRLSPDGQSIFYERYAETFYKLVKMPKNGGEPTNISEENVCCYDFSPDGKFLAFGFFDDTARSWKIALHNLVDNARVKVFDAPLGTFLTFTPDGKTIVYNRADNFREGGNLWLQPLENGEGKPLIEFPNEKIFYADFSPDGQKIAFLRGKVNSSAVLLEIRKTEN